MTLIILLFFGGGCYQSSNALLSHNLEKYDVTIYRDVWGVPHVYGDKDVDVAYGLAYAHAEDDLKTIQSNFMDELSRICPDIDINLD